MPDRPAPHPRTGEQLTELLDERLGEDKPSRCRRTGTCASDPELLGTAEGGRVRSLE